MKRWDQFHFSQSLKETFKPRGQRSSNMQQAPDRKHKRCAGKMGMMSFNAIQSVFAKIAKAPHSIAKLSAFRCKASPVLEPKSSPSLQRYSRGPKKLIVHHSVLQFPHCRRLDRARHDANDGASRVVFNFGFPEFQSRTRCSKSINGATP